MIPVLYSSGETEFTTNGIGRLSDCTSCHVIEERNGGYELEMGYPVNGIHYEDILISNIIYAVPSDGKAPQPFRIYAITKPINGIVTVYAEHISYQLSNVVDKPFTVYSINSAISSLKNMSVDECPFTFWTDVDSTAQKELQIDAPRSVRSIIGGEEPSILQVFGGEVEWDNRSVKIWSDRGSDNGVILKYGKNIIDLEQEESIDSVYTSICPYWKGVDDNNEDIVFLLPQGTVQASTASRYPYYRTIPVDFSSVFKECPTEAQLLAAAQEYIVENNIGVPKVSIKVEFVPLWQTTEYKNLTELERVNLCDVITVSFEKLGVDAKAKVVKTDYNVLSERYISIEVGEATAKLSNSFKSLAQSSMIQYAEATDNFTKELERATKIIAGVYGGNVVFDRTSDGEIYQISVMDKPDKYSSDPDKKAKNIIRINNQGIGFSNDGWDGQFNSAWLIDGTLDMGQINVKNLTANLLTTGILTDKAGLNKWNLDTGEFTVQATGLVDIGARNYIRQSNTLLFNGYYFGFNFAFNGEQAIVNNEEMEVAVG